jgi:hypothetical protein
MKKVLVLPGWMTSLELYESDDGFDVCIGELDGISFAADYVVGVSLGALIVLRETPRIHGKIILINPPLPKRNILAWFFRWISYVSHEGLFLQRQRFTRNPLLFCREFSRCISLLEIDFSETFDSAPAGKITVIRGKNDRFFCDDQADHFLRSKHIEVAEIEGGHNWCSEIETLLRSRLGG